MSNPVSRWPTGCWSRGMQMATPKMLPINRDFFFLTFLIFHLKNLWLWLVSEKLKFAVRKHGRFSSWVCGWSCRLYPVCQERSVILDMMLFAFQSTEKPDSWRDAEGIMGDIRTMTKGRCSCPVCRTDDCKRWAVSTGPLHTPVHQDVGIPCARLWRGRMFPHLNELIPFWVSSTWVEWVSTTLKAVLCAANL